MSGTTNKKEFKKEGVLTKKGMGKLYRPWHSRNFVLSNDHRLSYFDEKNVQKGTLKMQGAKVRAIPPENADGRRYAFEIYSLSESAKKSSLIVQAQSEAEVQEWIACLNLCFASAEKTALKTLDNPDKSKSVIDGVTPAGATSKNFENMNNGEAMKMLQNAIPGLLSVASNFPLIGPIASTFNSFYSTCQNVATNSKDLQKLRTRINLSCTWMNELVKDVGNDEQKRVALTNNVTLKEALSDLDESIKDSIGLVNELSKRLGTGSSGGFFTSGIKNIVVASDDSQTLKDVTSRLNEALADFRAAKSDYNQSMIYNVATAKRQGQGGSDSVGVSEHDFSVIDDISDAFEMVEIDSAADVLACLRRIYLLSGGDDFDPDDDEQAWYQVSEAQYFDQLVPILNKHSSNALIVIEALKVAKNISACEENAATLGYCDMCTSVMSVMKANSKQQDILAAGFGCVFIMSCGDSDAAESYGLLGAGKSAYRALMAFPNHEGIVENSIAVLSILAEDYEIACSLISMGCCELVVEAMKKFPQQVDILEACCQFCSTAASAGESWEEDTENKERLVSAGVLEAVCAAVEQHMQHVKILRVVCECLGNMAAESYDNKERIANLGVCELLVKILRERKNDEEVIAEAIKTISMISSNGKCKNRLLETDVMSLLNGLLWKYPDLEDSIQRTEERINDPKLPSDKYSQEFPETFKDCSHEHTLNKIRCDYEGGKFGCDVCYENGGGWVYNCPLCQFDVHLVCADSRGLIITKEHEHGLRRSVEPRKSNSSCDICYVDGTAACCLECNFDVCQSCLDSDGMITGVESIELGSSGYAQSVFTVPASEIVPENNWLGF